MRKVATWFTIVFLLFALLLMAGFWFYALCKMYPFWGILFIGLLVVSLVFLIALWDQEVIRMMILMVVTTSVLLGITATLSSPKTVRWMKTDGFLSRLPWRNTHESSFEERAPIHLAARRGDLETIRHYVQQGVDINGRSEDGWTALMEAAAVGQVQVVRYLLKAGADPGIMDAKGRTALSLAQNYGRLKVVEVLNHYSRSKNPG